MKSRLSQQLFAFLAALAWAVPALAPVDPPAGKAKPPVPPPLPPHKDKPPDPKPTVPGTQPAPKEPAKGVNVLLPVDPEAARPGLHEFTTLEGVPEDVTDIILNLKKVLLKDTRKFTPHFKGPQPVEIRWPPGTTTERRADGTEVGKLPGGTVIEFPPGGGLIIKRPDGTTAQVSPDGTEVVKYPDGTVVVRFPDGTVGRKGPDGTVVVRHPNGGWIERRPDGTVVVKRPGQAPEVHPPEPSGDFGAQGPAPKGPQQATPAAPAAQQVGQARTAPTTWITFSGGGATRLSAEVRQSSVAEEPIRVPPVGDASSAPLGARSPLSTLVLAPTGAVVAARPDGSVNLYHPDGCFGWRCVNGVWYRDIHPGYWTLVGSMSGGPVSLGAGTGRPKPPAKLPDSF